MNPYISKLNHERLADDLDKYIGKGKSIEQLGFQTREKLPYVIDGKKEYIRQKLNPSFMREG